MSPAKPYCDKLRAHFDELFDDELSPFLRGVVRKHLQSCAPCRQEFRLYELTVQTVKKKSAPDVPPRLLKKVVRDLTSGGQGGQGVPKDLVDPKLLDGFAGI
jgi:hypothetical protein